LIRNVSQKYFPLVSLDLLLPPSFFISEAHKGVGGIPKGSKRRIFLKIKGKQIGIFPLKVRINSKNEFIVEKEFEIQVGDVSKLPNVNIEDGITSKTTATKDGPLEGNIKVCQKCGGKNKEDAVFCMFCGQDLKSQSASKMCPNCGVEQSLKAKFCGSCGTKLE
jgi:ribosomal protein L40E